MSVDIEMPRHGLSMSEGMIQEWRVQEGDQVAKGDVIFVIETEKSVIDVEAPAGGTIKEILKQEGDVVPVGATVAILEETVEEVQSAGTEEKSTVAEKSQEGKRIKASPAARKLAQEKGVDLSVIKGSGPNGRIVLEDVTAFMESMAQEEEQDYIPMNRIKQVTGARMQESFKEIPHFYLGIEVNCKPLQKLKTRIKDETGKKISLTVFFLKAVGEVLQHHPLVNASWDNGKIKRNKTIAISLATATDRGLMVPVIPDCASDSLVDLAEKQKDIVQRSQEGTLKPEEQEGGTFTITNLGSYGIDDFNPIINPPQAAILSIGSLKQKLVAEEDMFTITSVIALRLAADHRILDGVDGARFLKDLKDKLEKPENLFE